MGLYSATKHSIEGMSESLDHETRQFGVRVVLVEPSCTRTNRELNAPKAAGLLTAYDTERRAATSSVANHVNTASDPRLVADATAD
ncbi:SDR family NAD(P)-dependent oxidoreductase [Paraburkholderia sp. JPY465]|uniref:SDR family NAD(P)-dependent oxidoreductase n=1 Tax=Paraburkholderia sp. JPY465 TaxID=3042285 RepID=UPI003D263C53